MPLLLTWKHPESNPFYHSAGRQWNFLPRYNRFLSVFDSTMASLQSILTQQPEGFLRSSCQIKWSSAWISPRLLILFKLTSVILHVVDKAFSHMPSALFYLCPHLCPLFLSLLGTLVSWTCFCELNFLECMALLPWGLWFFPLPECSSPSYPQG